MYNHKSNIKTYGGHNDHILCETQNVEANKIFTRSTP